MRPGLQPPRPLLLRRHLLFDIPPGAYFETSAHPTERLRRHAGCLRSAHRAPCGLFQPIGRNRALRLLQNFGWHNRLGFGLRFPSHKIPNLIPIWQNPILVTTSSRCLWNLHNYCDIQSGPASWAPLSRNYPDRFPLNLEFRGDSVSANRAVHLPCGVVLDERFHDRWPHFFRRGSSSKGCTKFVKNFKFNRHALFFPEQANATPT